GSGKTTLFNALTGAGADPYAAADRPHVGMAPVEDERLEQVAGVIGSAKATRAAVRVLDAAGTSAAQLGTLRRADPLLRALAELPPEDAAEFRDGPSALNEIVRKLFEALDLIVFFTANENEARAWTLRRGRSALEAAGSIHTDMAHGFVRCEVIRWSDLVEA